MTNREKGVEILANAFREAYLLGFNASGEGYNGEYPFSDNHSPPESNSDWCKNRDEK